MTTFNKATLKTFFETNDVPAGQDYANLIDSQINIVETALQSMSGTLQAPELVASRVSAGNVNITGTLSVAGATSFDNLTVSAFNTISLLANNVTAVSGVFTSDLFVTGELLRTPSTYVALGTAQATATVVSAGNCILTGVVDGQTTGFRLMANKTGLNQILYNQSTVSANLWPCTGGQINALASNAAFGMAGSTLYTVFHTKASGAAVK